MAEEKKNGNGRMMGGGMTCSCGCGSSGRHWTFFLLRTLLTIIILMMVFWFGVVAGRLGDARGYMVHYDYATPVYNGAGGMGMPMIPASSTSGTAGY